MSLCLDEAELSLAQANTAILNLDGKNSVPWTAKCFISLLSIRVLCLCSSALFPQSLSSSGSGSCSGGGAP